MRLTTLSELCKCKVNTRIVQEYKEKHILNHNFEAISDFIIFVHTSPKIHNNTDILAAFGYLHQ